MTARPRGAAVLPFVIYLLGRPVHEQEKAYREDLLSLTKFIAEATPAECKTILGWDIDTRRLLITLLHPSTQHGATTSSAFSPNRK